MSGSFIFSDSFYDFVKDECDKSLEMIFYGGKLTFTYFRKYLMKLQSSIWLVLSSTDIYSVYVGIIPTGVERGEIILIILH